MKLKEIANISHYSSVGYIESQDSLKTLESYILYNINVLKEFKNVIIATNYKEFDTSLVEANKQLWEKYFPNPILIDLKINRGHSFGIADQENAIVDYCKENNIKWLCKASHDVVLESFILNKEIPESDFYYMNGIGFGGMKKYNFDLDIIAKEDFYPQTNFYFIDVSKLDYLYDKGYVNETYDYIQTIENYSNKVWEYIEGWSCEDFLKQCVKRNNLSKHHLVSPPSYRILLETIKERQLHDCSHKNIMIEGICHFQFPNSPIIKI